jgi:protein TonB
MILERIRYGFLSRLRRPEGLAPKVAQNMKVRLGMGPRAVFELSLSGSLLIIVLLFKLFPEYNPKIEIRSTQKEYVRFDDVELTRQINRPPPPPRPSIPIETTSDEPLDDIPLQDSELNLAEEVPPPPPSGSDDEESYFVAVEDMPQLIGGIEKLRNSVVYPELAVRAGIQGKVFVMAYVNPEGNVVRAELVKGIGGGCDEAAIDAVIKAKFIPGKQRGKPVKVKVVIPIQFRLKAS